MTCTKPSWFHVCYRGNTTGAHVFIQLCYKERSRYGFRDFNRGFGKEKYSRLKIARLCKKE